ncbi:hypothetical protein Tsp_11733 [Trichinella spiralis]|uniref:hypothetical protein n=1 Tax=Trichinella spiralis TaxID=6334 RepID=UPI0001EFE6ED|nr:hypothetical protein Tsp_11733 [Trichinella spiralis]
MTTSEILIPNSEYNSSQQQIIKFSRQFYPKFTTNQSVKRHVFDVYSGSTPEAGSPLLEPEIFGVPQKTRSERQTLVSRTPGLCILLQMALPTTEVKYAAASEPQKT